MPLQSQTPVRCRSTPHPRLARGRGAFTLIELLVVIAVIAILLAILLPSLSKARESGRFLVCRTNLKQLSLGFTTYAGDYRFMPGAYWQGPINLDWSGRNNAEYLARRTAFRHPFETSPLRHYLDNTDRIMECPSAKREANNYFDYTMVIRMAGAQLDLPWRMTYPSVPGNAAAPLVNLPSLLLLAEEHDLFYNDPVDDGSFAGQDQFSTRHAGRAAGSAAGEQGGQCNLALIDGSAISFKPPVGPDDRRPETRDLSIAHLRVIKGGNIPWPIHSSTAAEYKWINRAR